MEKKKTTADLFARFLISQQDFGFLFEVLSQVISIARKENEKLGTGFLRGQNFNQFFVKYFMNSFAGDFRKRCLFPFIQKVAFFDKLEEGDAKNSKAKEKRDAMISVLVDHLFSQIERVAKEHGVPKEFTMLMSLLQEDEYSAVVFLRFLSPALSNPKTFGVTGKQLSIAHNSNLVLLSKIIQRIANGKLVTAEESLPADFINANIKHKTLDRIYAILLAKPLFKTECQTQK